VHAARCDAGLSRLLKGTLVAPAHPRSAAAPVRRAGFTLLELMVTVAIASVLAAVAYPSFREQIDKSRRADAIEALIGAQMAQERWRANQSAYGSLGEIGVAAITGAGHYTIEVTTAGTSGYELLASARGTQRADAECRHLRLSMVGANFAYASGPDVSTANSQAANRRCWSL
jgi:type IV pilus assembly protein PilE